VSDEPVTRTTGAPCGTETGVAAGTAAAEVQAGMNAEATYDGADIEIDTATAVAYASRPKAVLEERPRPDPHIFSRLSGSD
jgi:hypothetical protein